MGEGLAPSPRVQEFASREGVSLTDLSEANFCDAGVARPVYMLNI